MSGGAKSPVGASDVRTLANAAGLSLQAGRERIVHEILAAWLKDAHELNRKMSERKHGALMPLTVFRHPRR